MTWSWAITLIAVLGASVPGSNASTERVVFCAVRAGPCATPTSVLGTSTRGSWGLESDATLLGSTTALPPVLYLGRQEYDSAVAGLGDKEREQAVLHRLALVSKDPAPALFSAIERDLLAAASATLAPNSADLAVLVEAASVAGGGDERFTGTQPTVALGDAREDLARVLVELPKGAIAGGYAKEENALAQLQADVTRDPKQLLPPFAESTPAYFVASVPRTEYLALLETRPPTYEWQGGVVTTLGAHDLAAAPWKTRTARLVYPGPSPFLQDLTDLTDAQMAHRLRARVKGGVSAEERAGFVAGVAFEHAVLLRQLSFAVRDGHVPWLSRFNDVVALDVVNLRSELSAARPEASRERRLRLTTLRADVAVAAAILRTGPHAAHDLSRLNRIAALARAPAD